MEAACLSTQRGRYTHVQLDNVRKLGGGTVTVKEENSPRRGIQTPDIDHSETRQSSAERLDTPPKLTLAYHANGFVRGSDKKVSLLQSFCDTLACGSRNCAESVQNPNELAFGVLNRAGTGWHPCSYRIQKARATACRRRELFSLNR